MRFLVRLPAVVVQDVGTVKAVGNQSYNRLVERVLSHPEAMAALQTVSGSASFSRRGDAPNSASEAGEAPSSDATAADVPCTDPTAPEPPVPASGERQQAEVSVTQPADALRACTEEQPSQPGSAPEAGTEAGDPSPEAVLSTSATDTARISSSSAEWQRDGSQARVFGPWRDSTRGRGSRCRGCGRFAGNRG